MALRQEDDDVGEHKKRKSISISLCAEYQGFALFVSPKPELNSIAITLPALRSCAIDAFIARGIDCARLKKTPRLALTLV